MILDEQVPTADPGELIVQLTPLLYKIAKRFTSLIEKHPSVDLDDLLQAGRIVIYNAQKRYSPSGEASFISYIFKGINEGMLRTIGMNPHTRELPPILESVDEPLSEESDETRLDFIPDNTPTAEERIVEQDGHQETADAVRAAIDRLKNAKQREIVKRIWLDGEDKDTIAADLRMTPAVCGNLDLRARQRLKRDIPLKEYAAALEYPVMHVGSGKYQSTWTSAVEASILWRERRFDERFGDGAFLAADAHDPDIVQTSIQAALPARTEATA